jgi:hypothetical protein
MPGAQVTDWSCEDGTPFPNLNEELDPDDIFPGGKITNQFWRNLYQRNENRYN